MLDIQTALNIYNFAAVAKKMPGIHLNIHCEYIFFTVAYYQEYFIKSCDKA